MTADAAGQLRRLLQVIPKLNDGKPHSLDSVAKLAGTNPETVLDDLLSLSNRFGDPGGFVPALQVYVEGGRNRGVSLFAPQFKRPMGLSAAELCALDLGLAMLRAERPPEEHRAIDGARARLRKAVAQLPRDGIADPQRYAALGTAGDAKHLPTLRHGIRNRRRVQITYRAATARESTSRSVCPYGLVASHGAWYVVGYCDDRKAVRVFRLDRIEEATLSTGTFQVPVSFSLESVVQGGRVFHGEGPETVRVRYSPKVARWIAEREQVSVAGDGSVTIEYPLADAQWAVRHVLQYGPDAEVLAPQYVRDAIVERLRSIVDDSGSTIR